VIEPQPQALPLTSAVSIIKTMSAPGFQYALNEFMFQNGYKIGVTTVTAVPCV
jgi:hypothetical protein